MLTYISDLKTFRKISVSRLVLEVCLLGRKEISISCLRLGDIYVSEHSRVTVDVLNALNDQSRQGLPQHSELNCLHLSPLEFFIHWGAEDTACPQKGVSQNCLPAV